MPDTALRRRCEQLLPRLPIPDPFDLERFQQRLADQRGRPLHVQDMPSRGPGDPSGLWLGTATRDFVFVDPAARPVHREHIILHELAHMVLDHESDATGLDESLVALLPSFDPSTIKTMLGRTRYSATEEQEAELLATLIGRQARGGRTGVSPDVAALRARLHSTLG